jgi:hypothetical protein
MDSDLVDSHEEEVFSPHASIDKLTLELLLNKTHYQKYLFKTDPQRHAEYNEFLDKLAYFRDDILHMTTELLDNPKKMYTNEVGDAFDSYVKSLVKYLEIEHANKCEDAGEVLFPLPSNPARPFKKNTTAAEYFHAPTIPRSGTLDNWIDRGGV